MEEDEEEEYVWEDPPSLSSDQQQGSLQEIWLQLYLLRWEKNSALNLIKQQHCMSSHTAADDMQL